MTIKLTTDLQLAQLNKGDIIKRFPTNGTPVDLFDDSVKANVASYEIRSIDNSNHMLELVMADDNVLIYPMPGDVSRVFIKAANLLSQKVWWV